MKILQIKDTKFPYKNDYFYIPLTDYKKLYNSALFSLVAQKTSVKNYLKDFYNGKFEYPPYFTEPIKEKESKLEKRINNKDNLNYLKENINKIKNKELKEELYEIIKNIINKKYNK